MVKQNLTCPNDDLKLELPQSSVPDCSRLGRPDDCEYGSLIVCVDSNLALEKRLLHQKVMPVKTTNPGY